jgi:hypothetical protein
MRSEISCIWAGNGHASPGTASRRMSFSLAQSIVLLNLPVLHGRAYGQSPRAKIIAPVRAVETRASAGLTASTTRLPLSFEANHGQTDPQVRILSRANGYGLFVHERAAMLALHNPAKTETGNAGDRLPGNLSRSGERGVQPVL